MNFRFRLGEAEKVTRGRCGDEQKRGKQCGGEMTGQSLRGDGWTAEGVMSDWTKQKARLKGSLR